ncbi:contact-dependent growth inhibition system immunity protein [Massilia frigida]|uniref:contact-dependent growth inhibition system immunity protein n=1 Tax=Massilia frigida TaxID=2609281 RepID=UPI0014239423
MGEFGAEDLRLCLGQDIGIAFLLPLALPYLEMDSYSEGMHYRGDLLCNVLRIDKEFHNDNPHYKDRAEILHHRAWDLISTLDEIDAECLRPALAEAAEEFSR